MSAPKTKQVVMNLFFDIRALVIDCPNAMVAAGDLPEGLDFKNVTVEFPRDALHGDMATMRNGFGKTAKLKPRDIAEKLAHLASDARVNAAEVAGPGFLNMRLGADTWQGVVSTVLANPQTYGRSDMGQGRRVNVNAYQPIQQGRCTGHTRSAVFGDALASLLDYAG